MSEIDELSEELQVEQAEEDALVEAIVNEAERQENMEQIARLAKDLYGQPDIEGKPVVTPGNIVISGAQVSIVLCDRLGGWTEIVLTEEQAVEAVRRSLDSIIAEHNKVAVIVEDYDKTVG
jgi:hypothetical protein